MNTPEPQAEMEPQDFGRFEEELALAAEVRGRGLAPEWDDADSAAYHARVEAGLEPEAGQ